MNILPAISFRLYALLSAEKVLIGVQVIPATGDFAAIRFCQDFADSKVEQLMVAVFEGAYHFENVSKQTRINIPGLPTSGYGAKFATLLALDAQSSTLGLRHASYKEHGFEIVLIGCQVKHMEPDSVPTK